MIILFFLYAGSPGKEKMYNILMNILCYLNCIHIFVVYSLADSQLQANLDEYVSVTVCLFTVYTFLW